MTYISHTFSYLPSDPFHVWQVLHPQPRYGFFLGSPACSSSDVYMSVSEPKRIVFTLHELKKKLASRGKSDHPRWVGCIPFSESRSMDPALARWKKKADPLLMPGLFFGDYPTVVKFDFRRGTTSISSCEGPALVKKIFSKIYNCSSVPTTTKKPLRASFPDVSPSSFSKMVHSAKTSIQKGDIYQANLSLRFSASFSGNPINLYRILSEKNPSPYAALLRCPDAWIVSNSPELLLHIKEDMIITRPIAGTRPRGKNTTLDQRASGRLLLSPKERAEHLMLIDLERNDLGRICRPGTVKVSQRFIIEKYSHVMHIVSQVTGRLQKKYTALDAVKAVFPGGTITGCPKIKAVEIIERLEKHNRGIFYGSAGFFRDNGDSTLNILIRTAFIKKHKIHIQAGAGIVADSRAPREYLEILAKAKMLREAVRTL